MRLRFSSLSFVAFALALLGCGSDKHPGYVPPLEPDAATSDARDGSPDAFAEASADASRDGAVDATSDAVFPTLTWSKLAAPTLWTKLVSTVAVDAKDDVFVTDGAAVYMLDEAGTPSVYLTAAEVQAAAPADAATIRVAYLDLDPSGSLYLLVQGPPDAVYVSSAAHVISSYAGLDARVFTAAISAVSGDRLLGIDRGGMFAITKAGLSDVYSVAAAGNGDDSPLVARRDGYVYLAPGCNQCDLNGGKSDGSGIAVVLRNDDVYQSIGKSNFVNFTGLGRDQTGDGVYVAAAELIVHLGSDGSWRAVPTSPAFGQFGRDEKLAYGFGAAAIGAGATGTLYVVTTNEGTVYRAAP